MKKIFSGILFVILISSQCFSATRPTVTLISVAGMNDQFWLNVHAVGKAAANDLGINLEILYSNRDHYLAVNIARNVANRKNKPDYVIVVGEKNSASRSIPILDKAGIKTFLFGEMTSNESLKIGQPREKFKNYIGKRAIDDYMAGYLSAKYIFEKAIELKRHDSNGKINILSLEGVRETSFNSERVRGLQKAMKEFPQVVLLQSVSANWNYNDAKRVVGRLLARHKHSKISAIWCANSQMARGAQNAFKNNLVSGVDWGNDDVQSIADRSISAAAGGHVLELGWILTMLYDHHFGKDFSASMYKNKVTLMDYKLAKKILKWFGKGQWGTIDFKKFSKAYNPTLKKYNMNFSAALNSLNK
ncbi:MAG: ABC transporter substrate-binding protein [Bacteriovoracaceae bacterium]|nr:ABC transporter substrate-binding protein [Bacteriovoracaceae bacterium]